MTVPDRTGPWRGLPGRARLAAVGVVVAVGLTSCAGETAPVEAVPALGDRLAEVDDAVVRDDPARAAATVDALRRLVVKAQRSGDLSDAQAEAILDAADELLRRLEGTDDEGTDDEGAPAQAPTPEESSAPTLPEQAPEEPEDDEEDEDEGKGVDEDEGHDGKGHGKGEKHGSDKGKGHRPDKGKGPGN